MKLHISIDLGDTLFDRTLPRVQVGKGSAYQLFPGAFGVLNGLVYGGDRISVISKIDPGNHTKVGFSLFHHGLVPWLIDPKDVHFCQERGAKGPIAELLKPNVHIDDRVQALNAVGAVGVPHLIMFTGVLDESVDTSVDKLIFPVHKCRTWDEVFQALLMLRAHSGK